MRWREVLRELVLESEGIWGDEGNDAEEPGEAVTTNEVGVRVDREEEGEEGGGRQGGDVETVLEQGRSDVGKERI